MLWAKTKLDFREVYQNMYRFNRYIFFTSFVRTVNVILNIFYIYIFVILFQQTTVVLHTLSRIILIT